MSDGRLGQTDLAKVDATTEADIRRHMVEDGEIPERYLESVDLGEGIRGVVVGAWFKAPDAYLVEVFLAPDSMGDEVITMVEDSDGKLVPADSVEWEDVKRREPNVERVP